MSVQKSSGFSVMVYQGRESFFPAIAEKYYDK